MAEAGCPEPKPVFIALTTAMGAAAGGLAYFILYEPHYVLLGAGTAGAFGCAIGTGIAMSTRLILRVLVTSLLVVPAGEVGFFLGFVAEGGTASWKLDVSGLGWLAIRWIPLAIMTLLSHQLMLKRTSTWKLLPVYVMGGLGCALIVWISFMVSLPVDIRQGVFFKGLLTFFTSIALLQYFAMLAALAVDRKMRARLEPPPSAPSPGPGP